MNFDFIPNTPVITIKIGNNRSVIQTDILDHNGELKRYLKSVSNKQLLAHSKRYIKTDSLITVSRSRKSGISINVFLRLIDKIDLHFNCISDFNSREYIAFIDAVKTVKV